MTNPPLAHINEISKYFGAFKALHNVSFEIPEAEITGLLGPNGAGKTSLLRILNQIIVPDSGTVTFHAQPLSKSHIAKIGYLPEERGLYNSMKVAEQAIYLATLKGLTKAEAKQNLTDWFERWDMMSWWNKSYKELSKGMAQKFQFIVSVLHKPELLILDEPFSGFDPINAELLRDAILELKNQGTSIILSTHRMENVESLCNQVVLLNQSKVVLKGKVSDLKQQFFNHEYLIEYASDEAVVLPQTVEVIESKSEEQNIKVHRVKLKMQEQQVGEVLQKVMQSARLMHFSEIQPSMQEIFIKTVKGHA